MHVVENDSSKILVNELVSLMSLSGNSQELEIFESESLIQVITFKWNNYGK